MIDALLDANQLFYDAFEARDLDAMSDLWEHSERAVCTHPGWSSLRGWAAIVASFTALFRNNQSLQFLLTEARGEVHGDTGWVTVDENLLGDQGGTTVAALNLFVRDEGRWRLVVHHGSAVHASRA
jgi:ketosteroid isomerase-like protein